MAMWQRKVNFMGRQRRWLMMGTTMRFMQSRYFVSNQRRHRCVAFCTTSVGRGPQLQPCAPQPDPGGSTAPRTPTPVPIPSHGCSAVWSSSRRAFGCWRVRGRGFPAGRSPPCWPPPRSAPQMSAPRSASPRSASARSAVGRGSSSAPHPASPRPHRPPSRVLISVSSITASLCAPISSITASLCAP